MGGLIIWTWFSWWAILLAVPYRMLWCVGGDSRCHEAGHGTAFKTRWMNRAVSSLLPLYLTSLATLYAAWSLYYVGITQHVGLAEDVIVYRNEIIPTLRKQLKHPDVFVHCPIPNIPTAGEV